MRLLMLLKDFCLAMIFLRGTSGQEDPKETTAEYKAASERTTKTQKENSSGPRLKFLMLIQVSMLLRGITSLMKERLNEWMPQFLNERMNQ